jgi:hypothetical protein
MSEIDKGSITRDGAFIVVRIPIKQAHELRQALQPCPCKAPKSIRTGDIRLRLQQGLARAMHSPSFKEFP